MNLILKNFGAFLDSSFPLKQITIFFGPNESGKTTILDAIIAALIKIPGGSKYGRFLNERYDKKRKSKISDDAPANISPSNFLNTYAIREGRMLWDFEGNDEEQLIDKIRNSLHDSGYDANHLRKVCLEKSETKGNVKANNELKKVIKAYEEKLLALKQAEAERENTILTFSELPKSEAKKLEYERSLSEKESILNELSNKETTFLIREKYAHYRNIFQNIISWESKEKSVREINSRLSTGKEKLIISLNEELKERQQELKNLINNQNSLREKILSDSKKSDAVSLRSQKLSRFGNLIRESEERLDSVYDLAETFTITQWKTIPLIAGIVLFMLGFISILMTTTKTIDNMQVVLGGVLMFSSAVIVLFFARSQRIEKNHDDISLHYIKISDDLLLKSEGLIKILLKTKEGIREAIKKYTSDVEILLREIELIQEEIIRDKQKINEMELGEKRLKESIEEKNNQLQKLYLEFDVKNFEEFTHKLSNFKAEEIEFNSINSFLKEKITEFNVKDITSLKHVLKTEIQSFEEQGISFDFTLEDQNILKQIKNQIQNAKKELESLKETYFRFDSELAGLRGSSKAKIHETLQNWERCKREKEEAEYQKLEVEKTMQSYKLLADIFLELAEDSNHQMMELVNSLSKRWNLLLPTVDKRDIIWENFDESAQASDANQTLRALDHLSTGTKELFYFAIRLEYASRMSVNDNLKWILLDEPFRHMDRTRMISAVRYTLSFLKNENWKGVFFSFDPELKEEIEKNAKDLSLDCILHNLG